MVKLAGIAMKRMQSFILLGCLLLASLAQAQMVRLETDLGNIDIELYSEQAPLSSENFLAYVDAHFYDGTIFHRVIPNFMAQAGGMTYDFTQKETRDPVPNESSNGLRNTYASVAMARFSDPHSATSQFYINLNNNAHLDPTKNGPGYTVFGTVTQGMDVVADIAAQPQGMYRAHPNAPNMAIRILKAYRITEATESDSSTSKDQ